jgi:hypothetical protein
MCLIHLYPDLHESNQEVSFPTNWDYHRHHSMVWQNRGHLTENELLSRQ